MIPRAFQRRSRYDFRTYDMGCKKLYDFPSCEKRYTLKCGDVLKAFYLFIYFILFYLFIYLFIFLLLFKCHFVSVVVVVSLKKKNERRLRV